MGVPLRGKDSQRIRNTVLTVQLNSKLNRMPRQRRPDPRRNRRRTRSPKAKNWCFTLNNWTVTEWTALVALTTVEEPVIGYIIISREVGEEGTPHIQGYVQLSTRQRLAPVKRLIAMRARYTIAGGTASENKTYITKEAGQPHYAVFEWGTAITAGERKDLGFLRGKIKEGVTYDALVRLYPEQFGNLVRYHRGLERVAEAFILPRGDVTTGGTWLFGPTGSGKTYDAIALAAYYGSIYFKSDSTKWWPRYHGEQCIVWDDIRKDIGLQPNHILRLLDTGDHQVERKGGYCMFRSEHVIFTSPVHPRVFWQQGGGAFLGEDPGQLLRRLGNIVEYRGSVVAGNVEITVHK